MAQTGLKGWAALLLATTLAGCASAEAPDTSAVRTPPDGVATAGPHSIDEALSAPVPSASASPHAPVQVQTGVLTLPSPYRTIPNDTCGANALTYLVGRSRAAIPIPVDLSRRRVACDTCPVAQDYRPDRLNIFFNAHTGLISKVTCG